MAKDINTLRTEAQQVQNATQVGENTAQRVGGVLTDIVDKLEENQKNDDTNSEQLQADIKALGYYEDNPEFIRAYTDADGKFLWGIRVDGSIEWAKGVPTPIQNALKELADKIKDLGGDRIDEVETALNEKIEDLQDAIDVINASLKTLTDTFSYQDNPEFINVVTDNENKVLFGLTAEGKPYFPKNETYSVESNQEFLAAWLDAAGHVLFGLRQDGSTYVAKADFLDKIEEIRQLLEDNGIGDDELKQRVEALEETFSHQENEEFAYVVTDNEGKVLFGIKTDGSPYYPNNEMYHVIQNDEYLAAWVDASNKLLFGIKTDGSIYIAKSEYIDAVKEIQEKIANLSDSVQPLTETFQTTDNPEYMAVTTDSEGKVLEGTLPDGKKYFPKQSLLDKYDDVEGRTEITLDAENRVLAYRDKEGVKHEEKLALNEVYDKDNNKLNLATKEDVENVTIDPSEINIADLEGVSDHNTPNLLIASEMQKTFNDGTNSFTPPNAGYEMSNPIECQAGDWFTRTGTATGMVVVTDADDKNGTRLFNADGTTLGNTFQVPTDMTWVRYIRMAAEVSGAEDGSVVICKGKVAYTTADRGDYVTVDKLRLQNANIPKDIKYLKSSDGKYWELYVNDSHQLQIREIDPDIITELPSDFPVYELSGDFSEYFDTWISYVSGYLVERNKNGVVKFHKTASNSVSEFRKEKNLSGETRYITQVGNYTAEESYLTIYDEEFNILDSNFKPADTHDFVYFNDDHIAVFHGSTKNNVHVPIVDKDYNLQTSLIEEMKKINGEWTVVGSMQTGNYPKLFTDLFGIYGEDDCEIEPHQNTIFVDYDGNYVINLRNEDSFIKIKRTENSDGTVTIGSKTLDYDEAIIGRVGGKYNAGYIDSKRVIEEGFSFTDVPNTLQDRSSDERPEWQWYHAHDVSYWGMKQIGGNQYPTYTLFDNNMWTGNAATSNYNDINERNNYSNNPQGNDDHYFVDSKSDDGGAYDTNMVSRVVQLSIDWENHLIKDYKIYIIPKQYSYTRSGAQMLNEGVLFISWADQQICGLYDFNDVQTEHSDHTYKNGKEIFKVKITGSGFYRVHSYKQQ